MLKPSKLNISHNVKIEKEKEFNFVKNLHFFS